MTRPDAIRLDASLQIVDGHLTGSVARAGAGAIPFSGWIGLLGAIERACAVPEPRSKPPIAPPERHGELT
jgi:hypothetical protein